MSILNKNNINDVDWNKGENNLIPAIVQHTATGQVLMLGYMNFDALSYSFNTKKVTFYSRKTEKLWTKGETSGNFLNFVSAELDCDKDTILVHAVPNGPTCHIGDFSCFNNAEQKNINFLNNLSDIIKSRKSEKPDKSYTASLFDSGLSRMCQKVGEEGVEVALAGMKEDNEELKNESADLIFHLMILLERNNLSLSDIVEVLQQRHKY